MGVDGNPSFTPEIKISLKNTKIAAVSVFRILSHQETSSQLILTHMGTIMDVYHMSLSGFM
jgi:hypothetical protein